MYARWEEKGVLMRVTMMYEVLMYDLRVYT